MKRDVQSSTVPSTQQPDRSLKHFDFVDALRGFAVLGVVMVHCGEAIFKPGIAAGGFARWRDFTYAGRFGVQLFFVLSAFTLFSSLQTRCKIDRKPFPAFFVRRFFRIAPLFWTGLLFYLWHPPESAGFNAPNGIGWPHVVATLLFVHGWYPTTINTVVPGGWSIGAEVMFYLCLPLLFRQIQSLCGALWITLIGTIAVSVASPPAVSWIASHFPPGWHELIRWFVYFSFPSQLPVFCCGLVLYFRLNPGDGRTSPAMHQKQWAIWLLLLGIFLMMGRWPIHMTYAVAFLVIAWGLSVWPIRLVVNRLTRFIGLISYSIYIWHFYILSQVAPLMLRWTQLLPSHGRLQFCVLFAVVLFVSGVVGAASYYLIELPSLRAGRRLIDRLGWGSCRAAKSKPEGVAILV